MFFIKGRQFTGGLSWPCLAICMTVPGALGGLLVLTIYGLWHDGHPFWVMNVLLDALMGNQQTRPGQLNPAHLLLLVTLGGALAGMLWGVGCWINEFILRPRRAMREEAQREHERQDFWEERYGPSNTPPAAGASKWAMKPETRDSESAEEPVTTDVFQQKILNARKIADSFNQQRDQQKNPDQASSLAKKISSALSWICLVLFFILVSFGLFLLLLINLGGATQGGATFCLPGIRFWPEVTLCDDRDGDSGPVILFLLFMSAAILSGLAAARIYGPWFGMLCAMLLPGLVFALMIVRQERRSATSRQPENPC